MNTFFLCREMIKKNNNNNKYILKKPCLISSLNEKKNHTSYFLSTQNY